MRSSVFDEDYGEDSFFLRPGKAEDEKAKKVKTRNLEMMLRSKKERAMQQWILNMKHLRTRKRLSSSNNLPRPQPTKHYQQNVATYLALRT